MSDRDTSDVCICGCVAPLTVATCPGCGLPFSPDALRDAVAPLLTSGAVGRLPTPAPLAAGVISDHRRYLADALVHVDQPGQVGSAARGWLQRWLRVYGSLVDAMERSAA